MRNIISTLALLISVSAAQARDWVDDHSFGVAPVSCADWLSHRKSESPLVNSDVQWMFGFLTAMVRAKGPISDGGMTAEDFPGEIDELCAAHPAATAPAVLELFAIQHMLVAPTPSQNSN